MKPFYILFASMALTATSCTNQPIPCEDSVGVGTLIVRAMDSLDRDISNDGVVSNVHLVLSTDGNNYVDTIGGDLLETITINVPNQTKVMVVGWGNINSGGQNKMALNSGDNINLWRVSLLKLQNDNHRSPDDLFHGSREVNLVDINKTQQTPAELWLHRCVAAVAIKTVGLQNRLTTPTSDIEYIVRGTSSELDIAGQPINDMAIYSPTASINENGEFEAQPFRTLATPPSGRVTAELYVNGKLLFSASNDLNSTPFTAVNDKILYITLDMDNTAGSTFELAEWDTSAIGQIF